MTLTTSANLKVSLYTGPTTLISLLRAHFWGLDGVSSAEEGVREAPCFAREPPPSMLNRNDIRDVIKVKVSLLLTMRATTSFLLKRCGQS